MMRATAESAALRIQDCNPAIRKQYFVVIRAAFFLRSRDLGELEVFAGVTLGAVEGESPQPKS
jgi:hypothetical protein